MCIKEKKNERVRKEEEREREKKSVKKISKNFNAKPSVPSVGSRESNGRENLENRNIATSGRDSCHVDGSQQQLTDKPGTLDNRY